jgi:hypothetical protein
VTFEHLDDPLSLSEALLHAHVPRHQAENGATQSIVIFDTQTPIGTAQAVYMSGAAEEVTGADVARGIDIFSRGSVARGAGEWTPEKVQPPAHLRLYRATASEQFILCPRKYPEAVLHSRTDRGPSDRCGVGGLSLIGPRRWLPESDGYMDSEQESLAS